MLLFNNILNRKSLPKFFMAVALLFSIFSLSGSVTSLPKTELKRQTELRIFPRPKHKGSVVFYQRALVSSYNRSDSPDLQKAQLLYHNIRIRVLLKEQPEHTPPSHHFLYSLRPFGDDDYLNIP